MTDKDYDKLKQIEEGIQAFDTEKLYESSIAFFKALDYQSNKTQLIRPNNFEGFIDSFNLSKNSINKEKALVDQWKRIEFIFQVADSEITRIQSLFDTREVDKNEYQSFLFFTIQLKEDSYKRGDLVKITRELNVPFKMPVIVLFQYGSKLTLSIIDRRLHKKDTSKDVLEKVTLIKDIDIVNPQRAHKEILKDLSLNELYKQYEFHSFVKLHEAWKSTLNISELNKKFFKELADWYFWAMDNVQFPDDIEKKKEIRNATNLIRLITRIIFIWFIKEKKLVPENLFHKNSLTKLLKDFAIDEKSDNYYKAILQNLFFGTLNQRMDDRGFVKDGTQQQNKNEYGVKNLFRYANKFKLNETEILQLFKDIPFLNGGLFDCLDKPNDAGTILYVDGFSRNPKKQAVVPDFLFFGEEREVDLTSYYNPDAKKPMIRKVKGLFLLLENYKFTIAENTPIEEEIALDPELLGKVFENLLASYNPETQTTARKQTGSFYTPRDIVNYMVDESLIEYLKQKCKDFPDLETRLRDLFSYSENVNPFNEKETKILIKAINNCKMLDPACGSGAFPMGMLHKMVHILKKLDPDNTKWKAEQEEKIIGEKIKELVKDKDAIEGLSDAAVKEKARKAVDDRLKEIKEIFESENNFDDYSRKLFLIENCIYGVDIQPIAVQICKLRFFISLIIDQNKQEGKENMGIRSLPNLETKFVAANTLLGLEIPTSDLFSENNPIKVLQEELKNVRHLYFNAKTRKEKLQFQNRDKQLRKAMSEKIKTLLVERNEDEIVKIQADIEAANLLLQKIENEPENIEIIETINLFGEKSQKRIDKKHEKVKAQKDIIKLLEANLKTRQNAVNKDAVLHVAENIASFDPYDQNHFANWFEPEWMFGKELEDGFDIVIGNPPYIDIKGLPKVEVTLYFKIFKTTENRINLYSIFIEKGISLLNQNGILIYINPNSVLINESYKKIRKLLVDGVDKIIKLPDSVFEAATVETIILVAKKLSTNKTILGVSFANNDKIDFTDLIFNSFSRAEWQNDEDSRFNIFGNDKGTALLKKIYSQSIPLEKFVLTSLGITPYDKYKGHSEQLINNREFHSLTKLTQEYVPLISGKNIHPYFISDEVEEYLKYGDWLGAPRDRKFFELPKIIVRQIVSGKELKIVAGYSERPHYFTQIGFSLISISEDKVKLKFILGLLNSSLMNFYHCHKFLDTEKIVFQKILIANCKQLPVKEPKDQQPFIALVDQILTAKSINPKADTNVLEKQIDEMVYKLYELTEEEIAIVEGK